MGTCPALFTRQVLMDLDEGAYPTKPLVPFVRATQDRVVLEIQRGCIRGCRFCQAGMIYRQIGKNLWRCSNGMRSRCWRQPARKKFP